MDYSEIINSIKNASLFDLYRLQAAISNQLEDPLKISKLREKFREGDVVSYFERTSNSLIQAVVLKKAPRNVHVRNVLDHKTWKIPYYFLNLDQVEVDLNLEPKEKLTKNHLKVGDFVGFDHDGEPIAGVVLRLNQKTVSLQATDNRRWRVGYGLLYRVIDTSLANQVLSFYEM